MPIPIAVPIAIAAASAITGLMGQAQAAKSDKEKRRLLRDAAEEFKKIELPEQKQAVYEELKAAGSLTPEFEQAVITPDTEFTKVQADPQLKQAQLNALQQLKGLGESGGLDTMDQANIERAQQRAAAESASQQGVIQESLARRGMQSPGQEMVARQMAAQGQLNQLADFERQTQGEARRRALEAMVQGGSLAGNIRGQDVGEQERKAAAIDRINQMRVQNQIGLGQRNVERANQAQAGNLQNQQRIQDANVAFRNQAYDTNRAAGQKDFDNQLARARGVSGGLTGQSVAAGEQAQQQRNMWGGLAQGVSQMGSAYMQGQSTQSANNMDLAKMTPAQRAEYERLQQG
jgi:hypothetical protein